MILLNPKAPTTCCFTAPQMVDLLFDYTYNLGEAELASDQDIEVKTRFETTEAGRDLERNGSGRNGRADETMKHLGL